ncbi:MAG: HAD-IB family phosphatase [Gammaproteobacteria bacterium]
MRQALHADIVCFDFDSTLSRVEGIDELAGRVGLGPEMSALTDQAMNGLVALEAVYGKRLSLIRPDRAAIEWLADKYIDEMVEGAPEVIAALTKIGKQVHIVSGGIRQAILPMAARLGLPEDHVHAVEIYFDSDGSYRGFDADSPLARSGGKAEICRSLRNGQVSLVMIGDGQTDLESKQAGACFIGFGGVVERKSVMEAADIYIRGPSLTGVIDCIC